MRKNLFNVTIILVFLVLLLAGCSKKESKSSTPASVVDPLASSYTFGVQVIPNPYDTTSYGINIFSLNSSTTVNSATVLFNDQSIDLTQTEDGYFGLMPNVAQNVSYPVQITINNLVYASTIKTCPKITSFSMNSNLRTPTITWAYTGNVTLQYAWGDYQNGNDSSFYQSIVDSALRTYTYPDKTWQTISLSIMNYGVVTTDYRKLLLTSMDMKEGLGKLSLNEKYTLGRKMIRKILREESLN